MLDPQLFLLFIYQALLESITVTILLIETQAQKHLQQQFKLQIKNKRENGFIEIIAILDKKV
ncbi:MAG: hypothetical protein EB127_30305 [Alphaproteobacteria bacterium]|nr:hypothetical protein [Alphaproteobacteria bacterium]